MLEIDNIYNIDCLEGMKMIPDNSIDCIICDLPYGVLNKQSEGGGWDSIIPLEPLWEQYLRIAKPNAVLSGYVYGRVNDVAKATMAIQPHLEEGQSLHWHTQRKPSAITQP